MHFQVETYIGGEFKEQFQQLLCPAGIIIESTVEHTHVLYSVSVDDLQPFADCLDGQGAHGFFSTTDAEGAGVEAAPCGFQLHERFAPVEETAFLGWNEVMEVQHAGDAVVDVISVGVEVAESGDILPFRRIVAVGYPLRKHFFAFSPEHATDKRITAQEEFVVSQEFRSAQYDAALGQQGFYS